MATLPPLAAHILIPGSAVVGIIFAIFLWIRVSKISVANNASDENREYLLEEQRGDAEVCLSTACLASMQWSHRSPICPFSYSK
jgi:hypothetical protein